MAYKNKKISDEVQDSTVETVSKETAEAVVSSPSIIYKPKTRIPDDALVMVKNMTGGKLVYVSKRLNGYKLEWSEFGEEIPVEMQELHYMKNTDRKFFTENWIEVDINVLKDLNMDRFYTDAITIDEINSMFEMDTDELITKVKAAKKNIQNTIGIKAMEMIQNKQLTDINTISALEKALNCELYER